MGSIYTKTGDEGKTALLGGSRVSKNDIKVECYGTFDEVNAALGVVRALTKNEDIKNTIYTAQKKLFLISAELASDDRGKQMLSEKLTKEDIKTVENTIDSYTENLEPLRQFVVPGDNEVSSFIHVARTVVRRAERVLVALKEVEDVRSEIKQYTNRLSDLLFTLARVESNQ